jgi:hypothetical protein
LIQMQTATRVALYWVAIVLAVCGLSLAAHATTTSQPTQPATSQPAPASDDVATPTSDDMRTELESFGVDSTGIQIVVSDDPALNCGSAISVGGTGGGCTIAGGTASAEIVISPNADDHTLLHEFAHARYALGECAAEYYANSKTGYTEWAYPTCAQGIEPTK